MSEPKQSLADLLLAKIGKNDEQATVKEWVTSGYHPLNYAISGSYDKGFPVGRLVEIYGPSSSGKTFLATCAMKAAQDAGGYAIFMDHERTFDFNLAKKLGLNTLLEERFLYRQPKTFEESIKVAQKAATAIRGSKDPAKDKPIVVVFDSLAAMIPHSKADKDVDEYTMNDNTALARACSAILPAFTQNAADLNICAIFLNQVRTKVGISYGDPTTTPGGDAKNFFFSIRIKLASSKVMDGTGDNKKQSAQEVRATVIKNKLHHPFLTAKWRISFRGRDEVLFDVTHSLVDFLADQKVLVAAGPRLIWTDGKTYFKSQLIEMIEAEGRQSELLALLPGNYQPEADEPVISA